MSTGRFTDGREIPPPLPPPPIPGVGETAGVASLKTYVNQCDAQLARLNDEIKVETDRHQMHVDRLNRDRERCLRDKRELELEIEVLERFYVAKREAEEHDG